MNTLPKILVVLGPTAVGKSDLAVELALKYNGEVISADSRQVYKGLDIGTGKITNEERRGVPHHLLDIADPKENLSVSDWKTQAEDAIQHILGNKKLPIVCGGTGQYIESVVDNVIFPEVPPNENLRKELSYKSNDELISILKKLDTRRANSVDKNNPRRLIRSIEIATAIGEVPQLKTKLNFNALQIGLTLPREKIREKIRSLLEKRLDSGLVEEVDTLHKNGLSFERMDELGLEYRYVAKYLQQELSFDEMKEKLFTEISRYAKRQMTWFKRDKRIGWFTPIQTKEIFAEVKNFLSE